VVTPITEVDDVRQRISLVMDLQEGPPYRVGKIEVPGPDPRMESLLKSKLKRGDIFDPKLVEDFYKKNKSFLPADASPADNQLHTDVRNGRVDLVFDFRTCPQPQD
jgi:outer membrane protein assembly factor BamA